jgi:hypothetical protein
MDKIFLQRLRQIIQFYPGKIDNQHYHCMIQLHFKKRFLNHKGEVNYLLFIKFYSTLFILITAFFINYLQLFIKYPSYFYEKKMIIFWKHCNSKCSIVELFILFNAKWDTSLAAVLNYCLNLSY